MQDKDQFNWFRIYITRLYTEAAIVAGKLEDNQIPVQVLNKQDSMYNIAIGDYEIYVPVHLKDMAIDLLREAIHN